MIEMVFETYEVIILSGKNVLSTAFTKRFVIHEVIH